jgi:hypothetical protein
MVVDLASTTIDELTPEKAAILIKEMVQKKGIELELLTKEKTLPEGTKFIVNAQQPSSKGYVEAGHHRVYEGEKPIEALKAFKDPNTYAKEVLIKRHGYPLPTLCNQELLLLIPLKEKSSVKTMNLTGEMKFIVGVDLKHGSYLSIYEGYSGAEAVNAFNEAPVHVARMFKGKYRSLNLTEEYGPISNLYLFVSHMLSIRK